MKQIYIFLYYSKNVTHWKIAHLINDHNEEIINANDINDTYHKHLYMLMPAYTTHRVAEADTLQLSAALWSHQMASPGNPELVLWPEYYN